MPARRRLGSASACLLVAAVVIGGTSLEEAPVSAQITLPPNVDSVKPNHGPKGGGTLVVIAGPILMPHATARVFFGGIEVNGEANNYQALEAVSPPHAVGAVDVTVVTAYGSSQVSRPADVFTYDEDSATPYRAQPDSGSAFGGTRVAISGSSGLLGATEVKFGDVGVNPTAESDSQITAVAPDHKVPDHPAGCAAAPAVPSTDCVGVTVTLKSGAVVAAGKFTYFEGTVNSVEPMSEVRASHTSTTLPDGRVLVAGGCRASAKGACDKFPLSTAEIYDPTSGRWTPAKPLSMARAGHGAVLLSGPSCRARCGQVLVAGGTTAGGAATASAELYDPLSDKWTQADSMKFPHYSVPTLLSGDHCGTNCGKVLVADTGALARSCQSGVGSVELFDPSAPPGQEWSAVGPSSPSNCVGNAALLSTGKVLLAGRYAIWIFDPSVPTASAWSRRDYLVGIGGLPTVTRIWGGGVLIHGAYIPEVYDPSATDPSLVLTKTAPPRTNRAGYHVAAALPAGNVLVAGGLASYDVVETAEIYDHGTRSWREAGRLVPGRLGLSAAALPSGRILLTGGSDHIGTPQAAADVYYPAASRPAPHIVKVDAPAGPTTEALRVTLTGSGMWSAKQTDVSVRFDGIPQKVDFLSDDRVIVTTNLRPQGSVRVTVAAPDVGTSAPSAGAHFVYAGGTMTPAAQAHPMRAPQPDGSDGCLYRSGALPVPPDVYGTTLESGTVNSCTDRFNHTATRLDGPKCRQAGPHPAYCGNVLVAGGATTFYDIAPGNVKHGGATGGAVRVAASAELYDPAGKTWTHAGVISSARHSHTATLLDGPECHVALGPVYPPWCGKVLVAGGERGVVGINAADLYDPETGLWTPTGPMHLPRFFHSATLLTGPGCLALCGGVLVVGGSAPEESARVASQPTAEVYLPASGTWVLTAPLMPYNTESGEPTSLNLAELAATPIGGPNCGTNCGKVLITGGVGPWPLGNLGNVPSSATKSAQLFDPATATWSFTSAPMAVPRFEHSATSLDGPQCSSPQPPSWCGKVLIAGGYGPTGYPDGSAELFDPVSGKFAATAGLNEPRAGHTGTALPDGKVLVTGSGVRAEDQQFGNDGGSGGHGVGSRPHLVEPIKSAEVYDPAGGNSGLGSWTYTSQLSAPRGGHTATRLEDGTVVVAGGFYESYIFSEAPLPGPLTSTTELYTPAPTVLALTPNSGSNAGGSKVVITGTRFDGATEVGFGGTTLPASSYHIDSPAQITVTAPAAGGQAAREVRVVGPGGTSASIPPNPAAMYTYNGCDEAPAAGQIAYPAGAYSLIGLPDRSTVPSQSLLYSWFDRNSGAYDFAKPTEAVTQAGHGYWAYFSCQRPVTLGAGRQSVTLPLAAYHASMVGNPSAGATATASGYDFAASWDPAANGYHISGYREPQSLAVGQGMWVFSYVDGAVTVAAPHA